MSEPLQLIAKIQMTASAHQQYLAHKVEPATGFTGVEGWLAGKKWYGPSPATQITADAWHGMPVREWVASFTSGPYAPAPDWTLNQYDDASATWTFAAYEFSENYGDFVTALNVLRQASAYQTPNTSAYIAIVPYAFGSGFDDAEAIIELRDGKATFINHAPAEFVAYTLQVFKDMEQSAQELYDAGG